MDYTATGVAELIADGWWINCLLVSQSNGGSIIPSVKHACLDFYSMSHCCHRSKEAEAEGKVSYMNTGSAWSSKLSLWMSGRESDRFEAP
jgi:hypothetical protein